MSVKTIKILKVINRDKISGNGKPYISCSIQTLDTNGNPVWLSGFGNQTTKSYTEGQLVELDIYSEEYNGKTNLKFKTPPETNIIELLNNINAKLDALLAWDKTGTKPSVSEASFVETELTEKEEDINVNDIPF